MDKIDISIIVPVKNDMQYIEATINSILSQVTTLKFEVLLVDDGSTDGSVNLASTLLEHSAKPIPHRVLRLEDGASGVSAARNAGILAAEGEYILFVDADDMVISGAMDNMWNAAKAKGFDMVVGRTKTMGRHEERQTAIGKSFSGDEYIQAYVVGMGGTECWNRLLKKSFLLEKNLFFDTGLASREGELWNFRVALCKPSVCITAGYTYVYRDSRVGTIRDMDSMSNLRLSLQLLEKELDILHEECPPEYTEATAKYILGNIRSIIYDVVHTKRDEQFLLEVASSLADRKVRKLFELVTDTKDKFSATMREAITPSLRYFRKRKLFRLLRTQHDEVMNKAFQRVLL